MNRLPVLDATFLIDLRRAPRRAVPAHERLLALDEDLVVPWQAAVEYCAGLREPEVGFRDLVASYVLAAFDEPVARVAALLAKRAIARRRLPGWPDVQIAATAVHLGMFVVTRNPRDFRDALGVRAWDYASEDEPPD